MKLKNKRFNREQLKKHVCDDGKERIDKIFGKYGLKTVSLLEMLTVPDYMDGVSAYEILDTMYGILDQMLVKQFPKSLRSKYVDSFDFNADEPDFDSNFQAMINAMMEWIGITEDNDKIIYDYGYVSSWERDSYEGVTLMEIRRERFRKVLEISYQLLYDFITGRFDLDVHRFMHIEEVDY